MMSSNLDVFQKQRGLLFDLAYRMTGSASDADDILQDAYIRWCKINPASVGQAPAYLKTLVSHLAIDHLRRQKRRAGYPGPWLPEPLPDTGAEGASPGPDEGISLYQSLSLGFLYMLERLSPEQRAVFLLRNVYEFSYRQIAEILDKTEANCRQIERRARIALQLNEGRFEPEEETQVAYLERFIQAIWSGNDQEFLNLLADEVTLYADGGGKVQAALRPLRGKRRILEFLRVLRRRLPANLSMRIQPVNGHPGLVIWRGSQVESCISVSWSQGGIAGIYIVRNPDKLQRWR